MMTEDHVLLFRAAFGEQAVAVPAYKAWRERVAFKDIDHCFFRVLPQVVHTISGHGIDDPDLGRMKGILKHTWVSNIIRVRSLAMALHALNETGIATMVLKGAALFAQFPEITSLIAVGDFDILVRQSDAAAAIDALKQAGFRWKDLRLDAFVESDFQKLHAFALKHTDSDQEIDFHWWPLPRLFEAAFVEELFGRSKRADFSGVPSLVPDLTDHLFLAIARPEPWDGNEIFTRTVEAAHILRERGHDVDWARLVDLCCRHGRRAMAATILCVIRDELGLAIPAEVIRALRRPGSLLERLDFRIRHKPPLQRGAIERLLLDFAGLARRRSLPQTLMALAASAALRSDVLQAARSNLPALWPRSAKAVWRRHARRIQTRPAHIDYPIGFSYPEHGGRWTEGHASIISLPVEKDATVSSVRLTGFGLFGDAKATLTVGICAGRETAAAILEAGGGPVSLTVKALPLATTEGRHIVVALSARDPARPIDLGISPDARLLGFFVESVELQA